jgi:hypothetical protein
VHFVTEVSLYFWILRKILRLLIPKKSKLWTQIFLPLYCEWPKLLWPMMKRSLGQNNLFFHFPYFLKVYNNPKGYACWKCKKSQNSTHPTGHPSSQSNVTLVISNKVVQCHQKKAGKPRSNATLPSCCHQILVSEIARTGAGCSILQTLNFTEKLLTIEDRDLLTI